MNSPLFQKLSYSNAVHFKEYINQVSMFYPAIARLLAQQMRVNEVKRQAAQENYRRLVSVTPGRKPLWAKIEEETAMAYESLCRKYEHSTRSVSAIEVADIITQYRKEHPDPEPLPVLVFTRSIFREFYLKVVIYANTEIPL